MWTRSIWKISVPSTQFCCKPKNTLKIKYLKNNIHHFKKMKNWPLYSATLLLCSDNECCHPNVGRTYVSELGQS